MRTLADEHRHRALTLTAAHAWLGLTEATSPVMDLRQRYGEAWRWPPEDVPGMDWCLVWALSMTWAGYAPERTALTLHREWPVSRFKGKTDRHPTGQWWGSVGDFRDAADVRGCLDRYPSAGSIVLYKRGHAGIVVEPQAPDTDVYATVEGNVSNRVDMREGKPADAFGFVAWWRWPELTRD